jgi:probable addiction module antidote protein
MPKRTSDYRTSLLEALRDSREAAQYLNAALEDSTEMFLTAMRDVAESRQMAFVAEGAGVSRESLYRMLKESGNPTYRNFVGILKTLGLTVGISVPEGSANPTSVGIPDVQAHAQSPRRKRRGTVTALENAPRHGALQGLIGSLATGSLGSEIPMLRKPPIHDFGISMGHLSGGTIHAGTL